jgi:hypothetical protein
MKKIECFSRPHAWLPAPSRRWSRILAAVVLAGLTDVMASGVQAQELPPARVGTPYGMSLTGGTPQARCSIDAGDLPPGLSLSDDGLLRGTPRSAGTWRVSVLCLETAPPTHQSYAIRVLSEGGVTRRNQP